MQDFEGKTAVVTGAGSGIGYALAERFAEARMQVVLADIQADALEQAVERLRARQAEVIGVHVDTMLKTSVENLAQKAIEAYGKVHVLCNNAGVASTAGANRAVWEVPQGDWDWVMGVNFNGVLYGVQTFVPHMLEHGEPSHIVNTASLAGLLPSGGTYGVSKHGVLVLTETLCNDLKSRGTQIGASVLCPGFVNTQIADAERNRPTGLGTGASEETERMAITRMMLQQGTPPSEIAQSVFEAIEQDQLYVLPHPQWDPIVRGRVESVLARGGPAELDFTAVINASE